MQNIEELHDLFLKSTGISTDTRSIQKGNLFFALSGENFNGNKYAQQALDQGASYAVVDEVHTKAENLIVVKDVLSTLQQLASYHRNYLDIPIIALTGSNGKTTTKELITACLSQRFKVTSTRGNLNNHIGVPLTLLSMDKSTEIGVVEMGANHQKEIEALAAIAQPDYGLITNYGKAHLEGFGGIEGVIKGKSELYSYLRSHEKKAFVNDNDPIQMDKSTGLKRITFGSSSADYSIEYMPETALASIRFNGNLIESQLIGFYNSTNIAAACTVASHFQVPIEDIKEAIKNYVPSNNRSQIIEKDSTTIILDAYNANPSSMLAALKNFFRIDHPYKIAILGDMFEVGDTSLKEHQVIVELAESTKINQLVLIGETFSKTRTLDKETKQFLNYIEAEPFLKKINFSNTYCLIKASRGMALEKIVDLIQ